MASVMKHTSFAPAAVNLHTAPPSTGAAQHSGSCFIESWPGTAQLQRITRINSPRELPVKS